LGDGYIDKITHWAQLHHHIQQL